ncbi:MAG: hypothetical protein Kow0010_17360 [Dehalococcoidia bacterium]
MTELSVAMAIAGGVLGFVLATFWASPDITFFSGGIGRDGIDSGRTRGRGCFWQVVLTVAGAVAGYIVGGLVP